MGHQGAKWDKGGKMGHYRAKWDMRGKNRTLGGKIGHEMQK